jgi:LysM repeat protein
MSVMLLSALALTGCFNSESDHQLVVEETEELTRDLAAANRENDLLNQALAGIKTEQEQLQSLLNTAQTQAASAGEPGPPGSGSPLAEGAPTWPTGGYSWTLPSDNPATARPATASQSPIPAATPARAAASGKRTYKPKPGDVLTSIAARNHTTVEELVALNPYLARRRNYMIWETDKIILP